MSVYVDRKKLRHGAADSGAAGEHADAGRQHLAGAAPAAGMFGDFPDAHGFGETVGAAHEHHSAVLEHHQQILRGIAEKASYAEQRFGAMDERAARALRDVRCT
ncbi:MAG: DUF2563 family protein [Mycobacterium sp.]